MTTLNFADVSEFQSNIDAPTYLGAGKHLLICRIHNGNRADNMMPGRRDYLRKYDFKGIGWYQYLVADRSAKDQAHDFVDAVGKLKDNEWPILDLEAGDGDQSDRAMDWFNIVDKWAGFKAMLYSGDYFLKDHLGGSDNWNRPLWVASYGADPSQDYLLWQYADDAYFKGITPSHCDGNRAYMTTGEFMKAVQGGKTSGGGGGSSSGGSSSGSKAPKFPYPSDEWIGQPSNDPKNHSGCYGGTDTKNVKTWQQKMKDRGWSLGVDGCYGPESENVCRQFQDEKGLTVDGDVGPKTWDKTWSAPVTNGGSSGGGGGGGSSKPPADAGSGTDRRNRALKWMADHRGITEDPVNSNCDNRKDGIRAAQDKCAGGETWLRYQPWCGTWCFNALAAAGGVKGLDYNMASVAWIESRARAGKDPFSSWTTNGDKCEPGDLVVLFGSGTHVGMLREVKDSSSIVTEEGNTSVGSNGGSAQKTRSRNTDVYGYARVNYHGS